MQYILNYTLYIYYTMVNNVYFIYIRIFFDRYIDCFQTILFYFFLINTIYIDCLICIKTIFLYDDATQRDRGRIFLFNKFDKFLLFFTKFFHFFSTFFFSYLLFKYGATNISIVDLLVLIGGRNLLIV